MEQWRDRIQQFLPSAKIGYIQGSVCDTKDKDIVIGMIQSLCKKEYKKQQLDFGFTVIDECHHIAGQVFSQSLFTINRKYMLALSATPKRKDGLTHVLEWTFGKFIVPTTPTMIQPLGVKVQMYHQNPWLKERSVYMGGKKMVNIQDLVNQLAKTDKRNKTIVKLINQQRKTGKDILVLSDRVEHVKELASNFSTKRAGLFIGGMTEEQRNNSSTKQIIFATYQMVAEAFDVPRLNTLIMCTPKKDVIQIVGRILRKAHTKFNPLVIDILDTSVNVFKNWGILRRRYYNKMKYSINECNEPPKTPELMYNDCFSDTTTDDN
jgi:superfamily II DNA or RNA helicase